jgi:hypothetical protein
MPHLTQLAPGLKLPLAKMALKIVSVLVSSRRRILARCKYSVKVTVKVIWKRICIQQTESWFFLE